MVQWPESSAARRWIRSLVLPVLCALSSLLPAHAQVQRNFINLSFEQPTLTAASNATGCFVQVTDAQVPGWSTNHPNAAGGGTCTSPAAATGSLIELWRTNFNGVPARAGNNFAELNASAASRMFQTVCLVNGEQIRWQLSHRARTGTDVMSYNIDSAANQILRASTSTTGAGSVVAGSCGTGLVASATCNAPTTVNTWADYTGRFTWNGTSGVHNMGFEAISTGSGNTTVGNFLDEIQIFLTPYIELANPSASGLESAGSTAIPRLAIVGNFSAPVTLQLQINAASTATLGSDYTTTTGTANFTVTIPAGNYDGTAATGALFDTGITIVNDAIVEDNETIVVDLLPSPADYTIASTTICGGTANATLTYTITDDDVDVLVTKSIVGTSTPPGGGSAQFTVRFQNNTARPTTGATTAHDATVTLSDPLPAGFTAFGWTCSSSGIPAPVCPSASGTGPIGGTVVLPAGNGTAGGSLVYTVTGSLSASQCTATTNTATVTVSAPLSEAGGAQAGFTTPTPGGNANNTASVGVDPLCADLAITKSNGTGSVVAGTSSTYTLIVTNAGPDSVTGAVVTDTVVSGLNCPATAAVTCTGAACPAGPLTFADLVGGMTLGTLTATAGSNTATLTYTCNVP